MGPGLESNEIFLLGREHENHNRCLLHESHKLKYLTL